MNLEEEMQAKWAEKKRELDEVVKIALVGQPGAGKSSLINKLCGKSQCGQVDSHQQAHRPKAL